MKLDVTYLRYSDHKQDDGFSIEYQTSEVETFAANNGIVIDKYYIDKAQTATKVAGREEFFALINDVKEGKVKSLIVYKLSRLFRNSLESAKYRELFRKHGVKLMSVTEVVNEDTSSGRFQTNIMASVDQYQSETISDHVKSSMREMARQGFYTGGIVTYGFDVKEVPNGKKKRKVFVPHAIEADIVKRVFDMYVQGMSFGMIRDTLNNEGIRTRRGKLFTNTHISHIIKDDMYIGVYRYKTRGYDDIVIDDKVPAIVDKMVFILANERLNKKSSAPRARHNKELYTLTGKIRCEKCGRHFTGFSTHRKTKDGYNKHTYYACAGNHNFSQCKSKFVKKDFLENSVLKSITSSILNDEKIKEIAEMVFELCQNSPSDLDEKIKEVTKSKREITKQIQNLIDALANGTSDFALKRVSELETELKNIEKNLYVLNERKKTMITVDSIMNYMYNLLEKVTSTNGEEIKSVFDIFVNKIIVSDDKIEVELNAFAASPVEMPNKPLEHLFYKE